MKIHDLLVVGGGAAGYFGAINTVLKNRDLSVIILEKTSKTLQKVKVSGGGRCNLTHFSFQPEILAKNYPRGQEYLIKAFKAFGPMETIKWFESKGVKTKVEKDNRVFPASDSSSSIINCFENLAIENKVKLFTNQALIKLSKENDYWLVKTNDQEFKAKNCLIATGGSKQIWDLLKDLKIDIESPYPSLFTFKVQDKNLQNLMGISLPEVKIVYKDLESSGPLLFTHWGLSGPAILKLSAFGAKILHQANYSGEIIINFLPHFSSKEIVAELKKGSAKEKIYKNAKFGLPLRFWHYILQKAEIKEYQNFSETGKKTYEKITNLLSKFVISFDGKTTFKEEFVTAGGVSLEQLNLSDFSSKNHPNLFFAGEVLNIDGITGGFNFQAAWTTSYLVSQSAKI